MKIIEPKYGADNKGHYSQGIISNGMLYVSGQLSLDPDTRKVPMGDIKIHTRQALSNLERVLRAGGTSKEDVVQCRIYISDIENWDAVNEVYKEFFEENRPTRTIIPVARLHFGCLVEIEAIAEVEKC